jgi:hypothetical protein
MLIKMKLGKTIVECQQSEKQTMLNRGYKEVITKPVKKLKTELKEESKNGKT